MIKINIIAFIVTLALCWIVKFMSDALVSDYAQTLATLALFIAVRTDLNDTLKGEPK